MAAAATAMRRAPVTSVRGKLVGNGRQVEFSLRSGLAAGQVVCVHAKPHGFFNVTLSKRVNAWVDHREDVPMDLLAAGGRQAAGAPAEARPKKRSRLSSKKEEAPPKEEEAPPKEEAPAGPDAVQKTRTLKPADDRAAGDDTDHRPAGGDHRPVAHRLCPSVPGEEPIDQRQ